MKTLFLKPGIGEGGAVLDVFIPAKGRNINAVGELCEVTAYVQRRIAAGDLIVVGAKENSAKGEVK